LVPQAGKTPGETGWVGFAADDLAPFDLKFPAADPASKLSRMLSPDLSQGGKFNPGRLKMIRLSLIYCFLCFGEGVLQKKGEPKKMFPRFEPRWCDPRIKQLPGRKKRSAEPLHNLEVIADN
jgi:hypothetical protein